MDNPIFKFLRGKHYTLHGVSGTFAHEQYQATYPYPHVVERLVHVPDTRGKQSLDYQATRRKLGDDWDTDLTNAIEVYCMAAVDLGYQEPARI